MKRASKILLYALSLVAVAGIAYYIGQQLIIATVARERIGIDTIGRVAFLKQFRSQIPETPRSALEAELAQLTFTLDSILQDQKLLFVDRPAVRYARDNALVYLHVFQVDLNLAGNTSTLMEVLGSSPDSFIASVHAHHVAIDQRLRALLRDFDPAKLDPTNRDFFEKLSKQPHP